MTPSLLRIRTPLPTTLVSLSLPEDVVQQLRAVVGQSVSIVAVSSVESAADALLRSADACLVLAVPNDSADLRVKELAQLRAAFPRVPTLAILIQGTSSYRGALRLGSVGITEMVEANPELERQALLAAFARCHADGVASRLWEDAAIEVPESMRLLLRSAIRLAHRPVTVVTLASVLGLHERTLRKYCEDRHLTSPQWIIGWARVLVAAHYLDEPARSLTSVAELLSYPSACALRNQLRRYVGVSPSALRASGALRTISIFLKAASQAAVGHVGIQPGELAAERPPLRLIVNAAS